MSPYIGYDSDTTFIPGTLNTSSSLTIQGGGITQTGGDVNFDSGTLFIDEDLNRVGIGITTPGETLTVDSGASVGQVVVSRFRGNASGVSGQVVNVLTSNLESGAELQAYSLSTTNSTGALLNLNDAIVLRTSSVTSGGLAFTTANSTAPLIFATDSNERLRITPTGNVGIGTTDPAQKLHIVGNLLATGASSEFSGSALTVTGSSNAVKTFYISRYGVDTGSFHYLRAANSYLELASANNESIALTGGNVGIGTTNPRSILSLGSSVADNKLYVYDSPTDKYGFGIRSSQLLIYSGSGGDPTGGLLFGKYDGSAFSENVRFTNNGNVGIGTTNPTTRLQVQNGGISVKGAVTPNINFEPAGIVGNADISFDGTTFGLVSNSTSASLTLSTSSTERLRISSTGNVGIGTTNPSRILDVRASSSQNPAYILKNTGSTNTGANSVISVSAETTTSMSAGYGSALAFEHRDTSGGYAGALISSLANADPFGADLVLSSRYYGYVEGIRIKSSGNVGIGTTNPDRTLYVNGPARIGGGTDYGTTEVLSVAPGSVNFDASGVAGGRLKITSTGLVGINKPSPDLRLSIFETGADITNGEAIFGTNMRGIYLENSLNDNSSLGLWMATGSHRAGISMQRSDYANTWGTDLRFYTHDNSTTNLAYAYERLRIGPNGNVGIGTTNPGVKLDVNGHIRSTKFRGVISTSGDGQNNAPFQLEEDYNSYMVATATGAGQTDGNLPTWGLFWAGNQGAAYGTNGLGGPGNIWNNSTNPNEFVFVGNNSTRWSLYGNTGDTWQSGSAIVSGNVGIGTTNPTEKLHVIGRTTLGGILNNLVTISNDGTYTSGSGSGTRLDVTYGGSVIARISNTGTGVRDGWFTLYDENTATVNIAANASRGGNTYFNNGGNVGIGTTNPVNKLHLYTGASGASSFDGRYKLVLENSGEQYIGFFAPDNSYSGLRFHNTTTQLAAIDCFNSTQNLFYYARGGHRFVTESGGNNFDRLNILSNGNVGIGTNVPNYKLEVVGSFAATTKSFIIPHPTKKGYKLRYGSLEGPENGVYVRGRSNDSVIELPDYWVALVDPDSITVSLTPIGQSGAPRVERIENNKVYIFSEDHLPLDYFYMINAERIDVEPLEVEIPPTN